MISKQQGINKKKKKKKKSNNKHIRMKNGGFKMNNNIMFTFICCLWCLKGKKILRVFKEIVFIIIITTTTRTVWFFIIIILRDTEMWHWSVIEKTTTIETNNSFDCSPSFCFNESIKESVLFVVVFIYLQICSL